MFWLHFYLRPRREYFTLFEGFDEQFRCYQGRALLTDALELLVNDGVPPVILSDAMVSLWRDNCSMGFAPPFEWFIVPA
jgi:hypothetical protein